MIGITADVSYVSYIAPPEFDAAHKNFTAKQSGDSATASSIYEWRVIVDAAWVEQVPSRVPAAAKITCTGCQALFVWQLIFDAFSLNASQMNSKTNYQVEARVLMQLAILSKLVVAHLEHTIASNWKNPQDPTRGIGGAVPAENVRNQLSMSWNACYNANDKIDLGLFPPHGARRSSPLNLAATWAGRRIPPTGCSSR